MQHSKKKSRQKRNSVSSNRVRLESFGSDEGDDAMNHSSSFLYQIDIPFEFNGSTYGDLWNHLASQNIIALGLLRSRCSSSDDDNDYGYGYDEDGLPNSCFVFTNPQRHSDIIQGDKVFVLSQSPLGSEYSTVNNNNNINNKSNLNYGFHQQSKWQMNGSPNITQVSYAY